MCAVRLPDEARGRGLGQEAGLGAEHIFGRAPLPGKWACARRQTLTQVFVDPHVIDKGIRTTGLLARCWWPSTLIACRCTARKRSLDERIWPCRAPHLHSGRLLRCAVAAAGRCLEERAAEAPRVVCQRDAGEGGNKANRRTTNELRVFMLNASVRPCSASMRS